MKITQIHPQGYCGGVKAAIEKVLQEKKDHPQQQMTILGALVHNRYVSQMLADQGIETLESKNQTRLELLDQIEGGTVVFTAHGIHPDVRKKASEKGLQILDASCPFVLSTQKVIEQKRKEGYTIFYIGKKDHPEAEAAMLDDHVFLIETVQDIPDQISEPVFVTNQTTMSVLEIAGLFDEIRTRYPNAQFHDEICNATRIRQQAVLDLKGSDVDCLIVVGDPASNNTRKLAETGRQAGVRRILQIENASQLRADDLSEIQHAAITSGASTPQSLRQEVFEKAEKIAKETDAAAFSQQN